MFALMKQSKKAFLTGIAAIALFLGGGAALYSGCYPTIPQGCCQSGDDLDWVMPNEPASVGLCIETWHGTPRIISVDGTEVFICRIHII